MASVGGSEGSRVGGAGPLRWMRVVDLSTGIAGGYATKLLADAGADVVKVEGPGGDPLRRWSATGGVGASSVDGALFRHLATGKRSVIGAPGDPDVDALVATADLVVESGQVDPEALRAGHPALVVLSLTPFGRSGPLAGRPATDFVVQAECGSIAGRGVLERPPVQAGGRISEWAAACYGAPAAVAAVQAARHHGQGVAIDASWMEAATIATNLYSSSMWYLTEQLLGATPSGPARSVEVPSIYPTADGLVGFNTNGPQHAAAFFDLIERPDLKDSPYAQARARIDDRATFDGWVRAYTTAHTTAEVLDRAGELRVPSVRVNDAATLLTEEQVVARRFYEDRGDYTAPRSHYVVGGRRLAAGGRAPGLGADRADWSGPPRARDEEGGDGEDRAGGRAGDRAGGRAGEPAPGTPGGLGGLPLDGLRVLDITFWWAGPSATQLLAALGADVIHVESIGHPDPMRYAAAVPFLDRDRWWELSAFYLAINQNKRGITLDLGHPEGLALAKELVAWADLVVENSTPRVMPKFGLGWEAVHELNPRAVMMRMPAFGLDGPWSERLGFAQNMEQMSGMAFMTGYADQEPLVPRGPCDPLGGAHAALAALVALAERDETGEGSLVEVALVEGALNLTAEQVVEYTAYGNVMERDGNRSAEAVPQGLYPCRLADGEEPGPAGTSEQWLAVSVADDHQWQALVEAIGSPAWARDPGLAEAAGRRAAADRIDAELAAWAGARSLDDALAALQGAGVPAARLADPRSVHTHPHLVARGFVETTPHAVVGSVPLFAQPFRMSGVDRWTRQPAPLMGEHNADVLCGLLGCSEEDLRRLAEAGVVGDRPQGA